MNKAHKHHVHTWAHPERTFSHTVHTHPHKARIRAHTLRRPQTYSALELWKQFRVKVSGRCPLSQCRRVQMQRAFPTSRFQFSRRWEAGSPFSLPPARRAATQGGTPVSQQGRPSKKGKGTQSDGPWPSNHAPTPLLIPPESYSMVPFFSGAQIMRS